MITDKSGPKSAAISEYLATNPGSSPARIVEALREQGVVVSLGLAKVIKYGKGKKKKPGKKRSQQTVAAQVTAEPAVSNSELIRRFIARNPKAKPKAIEAGLKSEGVNVKMGLINAVKYGRRKKTGKRGRRRTAATNVVARAMPASAPSIAQLIEVKRFATTIGGADQVRKALEMLELLR